MKESIRPYINRKILVLDENTPTKVAARAMYERRVGAAVINDKHGHLTGFITDRDITCNLVAFDWPSSTPVSEIMSEGLITANEKDSISKVAKIMGEKGVRRVPIVYKTENGKEKCVGLITLDDLISSKALSPIVLSQIVRAQIMRRVQGTKSQRAERRKGQTLDRFNKIMTAEMALANSVFEKAKCTLLKRLVERLPYTEAAHFISQLPNLVQEDLLNVPAGPNLNINEESLVRDISKELQMTSDEATHVIEGFWKGLERFMDPAALAHVLSKLPVEMRVLFVGQSEEDWSNLGESQQSFLGTLQEIEEQADKISRELKYKNSETDDQAFGTKFSSECGEYLKQETAGD